MGISAMASGSVAVFGSGGQLGREIIDRAGAAGVRAVGLTRADADLCYESQVAAALDRAAPSLVVNAAAYTAVDRAESEPSAAVAGNVTGPEILARACAARGIPIIHFSTDYVFDGTKSGAYVESDPIAPLGVYGRTKADGEAKVRAAASKHVIIRTSWVYGAYGANFLKTMLRLARERDELRVVADQRGCPTATSDLAQATFAIGDLIAQGGEPWGTYHFAGDGVTSWHGFAESILAEAAPFTGRRPRVTAIATADYPTAARRPMNSELESSLFAATFLYRAKPWRQRVREVVSACLFDRNEA